MKKLIKMLPPKAVTAMLVAAALLLLSGSVGGTRAALTYYSDTYSSEISMQHIGVTLLELGQEDGEEWREVSKRDYTGGNTWREQKGSLLEGMRKTVDGKQAPLEIGKVYKEQMKVRNTGAIGEYVRVTVYKYWMDENGNKLTTQDTSESLAEGTEAGKDSENPPLDASMIDLKFTDSGDWQIDPSATTPERTVLYYYKPLAVGEETTNFTDSLTIKREIANKVTTTETETTTTAGDETITTKTNVSTYAYDGKQFHIDVEVDAVQDHNAEDAILSAWGRSVTITDTANGPVLTLD